MAEAPSALRTVRRPWWPACRGVPAAGTCRRASGRSSRRGACDGSSAGAPWRRGRLDGAAVDEARPWAAPAGRRSARIDEVGLGRNHRPASKPLRPAPRPPGAGRRQRVGHVGAAEALAEAPVLAGSTAGRGRTRASARPGSASTAGVVGRARARRTRLDRVEARARASIADVGAWMTASAAASSERCGEGLGLGLRRSWARLGGARSADQACCSA